MEGRRPGANLDFSGREAPCRRRRRRCFEPAAADSDRVRLLLPVRTRTGSRLVSGHVGATVSGAADPDQQHTHLLFDVDVISSATSVRRRDVIVVVGRVAETGSDGKNKQHVAVVVVVVVVYVIVEKEGASSSSPGGDG